MLFPEKKGYDLQSFHKSYAEKLKEALDSIDIEDLEGVYDTLNDSIQHDRTVFTCGNGGSSAIAEHLVCDFVKGASADSSAKLKVYPLLSTPILTAIANDIGYKEIFSYQIEKYSKENDILLAISSSGNSENIIAAIKTAKAMGLTTISFVGFNGGAAKELSDISVHVKAENYGIAEDAHHALMHIFAQYIRLRNFVDDTKLGKTKF